MRKVKQSSVNKSGIHPFPKFGAIPSKGGVQFSFWAPRQKSINVLIHKSKKKFPLQRNAQEFFSGWTDQIQAGDLYSYVLGGNVYPDPCSRFQPEGPHGPALVVDPQHFQWHDKHWKGLTIKGQVFYEIHVGTFTPEGTFDAIIPYIDKLLELGITVLEIMPIAEFPGSRNWGYDGVDLFAPSSAYGDYEAFKRLVDAAHRKGMGVILDVVYNHFGPDGNYLSQFSEDFFTDKYKNDWGKAINFDGENSSVVREFFLQNAEYWIKEFHLDGLRLDATQDIADHSESHIITEIEQRTRAAAAPRAIILVAENEPQNTRLINSKKNGGYGLDSIWIDDFHHTTRVALTGKREAYYTDYTGTAQELLSLIKRGPLYQGQYYSWQKQPRGTPTINQPAWAFTFYLQNHDQIANSLYGHRIHKISQPDALRAMTTLWLLAPETPLFFMGQEFGAQQPFQFFTDHNEELAPLIHKGRKEFLAQFPSYKLPASQKTIHDPNKKEVFSRCIVDHEQRNMQLYHLHKDLLSLRRRDPVIAAQDRFKLDGAILNEQALVLRYFAADGLDRLLVVNLGLEFDYTPAREPLLAPIQNGQWVHLLSSTDVKYGGDGAVNPLTDHGWHLPATSANFFQAEHIRNKK